MKRLIVVILIVFSISSFGQSEIEKGRTVYVDGIISEGEWCDSKIYLFDENETVNTKAFLKHDGENLFLAFIFEKLDDTSAFVMPEIFIDSKFNKGSEWQPDDYWFHVSAQDCYAVGKREDYSACRADFLLWRASPNWPFDGQGYDPIKAIEVSIPLSLIDVSVGQSIGLCISQVIYPGDIRMNIPKNANEDIPETWKEFVIK